MNADPPNRRPTGPMLAMLGGMLVIILTLVAVKFREMSATPGSTTQPLGQSTPTTGPITFFNAPGSGTGPTKPASWWYIVSIAVSLPLLFASRYLRYKWRRERRRVTGRCLTCGYDLRGDADQCPECGSTFLEHVPPE